MSASEWKPIEAAPKDGTDVLVYAPARTVTIAAWYDGMWNDATVPDYLGPEMDPAPTHWMPLPPPPPAGEVR